jgi:hypothetical protein
MLGFCGPLIIVINQTSKYIFRLHVVINLQHHNIPTFSGVIFVPAQEVPLGYGLDDQEFESWQSLRIFPLTTTSRPALVSTQPPIQLVPGAISLGVKRPGREADHSPPSSAEVTE